MLNNILYTLSVAAKVFIEVMAGKNAYNAFTETVALTKIMQQQGNSLSAHQFCQALVKLWNRPVSQESW